MTSFRFRLDKVLEWRQTELGMEESRLRQQTAVVAEIDRAYTDIQAAGIRAEIQVRTDKSVTGNDLAALGRYRLLVQSQEQELDRKRADARRVLQERQDAMMEARRRCRLLEKLKEKRLAEWEEARDREMEEIAAESFLANWKGRERKGRTL